MQQLKHTGKLQLFWYKKCSHLGPQTHHKKLPIIGTLADCLWSLKNERNDLSFILRALGQGSTKRETDMVVDSQKICFRNYSRVFLTRCPSPIPFPTASIKKGKINIKQLDKHLRILLTSHLQHGVCIYLLFIHPDVSCFCTSLQT